MNTRNRKNIKLTRLVKVFDKVRNESIIRRSDKSMSWDFERSSDYISDQGLQNHIDFLSPRKNVIRLGSERQIYELINIVVRNL